MPDGERDGALGCHPFKDVRRLEGAEAKCVGLAFAYQSVCDELGCHFFDAATVTTASRVDGVHLDAEQHVVLGQALAQVVDALLMKRGA